MCALNKVGSCEIPRRVRRPREDMLQGKKSSSSCLPGLRLNRASGAWSLPASSAAMRTAI
jgi:hypothetical protein